MVDRVFQAGVKNNIWNGMEWSTLQNATEYFKRWVNMIRLVIQKDTASERSLAWLMAKKWDKTLLFVIQRKNNE